MKRLLLMVLLLDVALITVALAQRAGRQTNAEAPPLSSTRHRPEPVSAAMRILQRDTSLPWWVRDPDSALARYPGYRLCAGQGRDATRGLALQAAREAALRQYAHLYDAQSDSLKPLDNRSADRMVTLETAAVTSHDLWTVHVLLGQRADEGE